MDLVRKGITFTKRDRFYQNKDFKLQATSDGIIEYVSCMFECSRQSLNIVASSRGCIIGNLTFRCVEDEVNCNYGEKVILSSKVKNIKSDDAPFIHLVEKHCTLSRLADDKLHKRYGCIILTGKGQPNLSTRSFLRKLKIELNIPVVAIMDFDPDGFQILSSYRCGAQNSAHENLNLVTPDIRWIGIGPKDIERIPYHTRLDMTTSNIKTGEKLLNQIFINQNADWVEALTCMVEQKKRFK
jgi:meiotic recombination protein SPO11